MKVESVQKLCWWSIILFALFTPIIKVVGNTFLVLAALSFIFYICKLKKQNNVLISPDVKYVYTAVAIFAVSMLPSILTSGDILDSADSWGTLFIVRFVGLYIITLVIYDFVQAKKIILAASTAVFIGSLMIIYQGLNGVSRANGFYGNPMLFATYLSVFLPIFLIAFFEKQVLGKYKWLAGVFFIISSLALIFNGTRGAWVAAIAVILPLMGYYILRNKKNLLICGLVLALVGGYFISDQNNVKRFSTINKPHLESERMCMWKSSINMFLDHPVTGVGMGRWGYEYEHNYILPQAKHIFNHPHNNFFLVLSTGGIIGLFGFIFIFGCLIYKNFKVFIKQGNPYALMLVTGILGFLIHGLTEANIRTSIVVKFCFVVFGALVVLSAKYKKCKE